MYPHERSLVKRLRNEPFALIGVNSDRSLGKLRRVIEKNGITWRSFWSGPRGTRGPVPQEWGVRSWPTIYFVDHRGVIRDKNERGPAMDRVVDGLLTEAR